MDKLPSALLDRAMVLAARPASLRGYWIKIGCSCGFRAALPMQMIAEDPLRAPMTIADILLRLRCKACHERPETAALVDDARGSRYTDIKIFSVPLLGPAAVTSHVTGPDSNDAPGMARGTTG